MILNIIECLVCNTLNWVCRFFLLAENFFLEILNDGIICLKVLLEIY